MAKNLHDPGEFLNVYRNGKRFDGSFITVFVVNNQSQEHRLGVTASKKAVGKSVQRNRAKRLLRETFQTNKATLNSLLNHYDWVLNAKATVLAEKVSAPADEFARMIEKVAKSEMRGR